MKIMKNNPRSISRRNFLTISGTAAALIAAQGNAARSVRRPRHQLIRASGSARPQKISIGLELIP